MGLFSRKRANPSEPSHLRHCSFCNKSQRDVRKLIAGPHVYICDECVDICNDVVHREPQNRKSRTQIAPLTAAICCSLCGMPAPAEESLAVGDRGVLCGACTAEVRALLN